MQRAGDPLHFFMVCDSYIPNQATYTPQLESFYSLTVTYDVTWSPQSCGGSQYRLRGC